MGEKLTLHRAPSMDLALKVLRLAFDRGDFVIIAANCEITYRGRAKSKLTAGDRICMFKEDGSVIVHRPKGYEPVNWQPGGSVFSTALIDRKLRVRVVRRRPREVLDIYINEIRLLTAMKLVDHGIFTLHGDEEDMRKTIILNPTLVEKGLRIIDWEKKVEPGFIDLYGRDSKNRLVVMELKKGTAGREAVLQLKSYVEALGRDVGPLRGILVAPRLAKGVEALLKKQGLDYRRLTLKKCSETLKNLGGMRKFL